MKTTNEELEHCQSIANDLYGQTGIAVPRHEIWRAIYGYQYLSFSAEKASAAILKLSLVCRLNGRGTKSNPLRFKDVLRRVSR